MPVGLLRYSFTAQVAELTVDPDTGFITIHDIWCAHDLGRTSIRYSRWTNRRLRLHGRGEALFEEQAYQGQS